MSSNGMLRAVASGAAGALAVTLLNESVRRLVPHAPRMDVIGERAVAAGIRALGRRPPRGRRLYRDALLADLVSNAIYYSLVGAGSRQTRLARGLLLGAAAGIGAVVLPPVLGLGRQPGGRRPATPLLTLAWYTAAGMAAALAGQMLEERKA